MRPIRHFSKKAQNVLGGVKYKSISQLAPVSMIFTEWEFMNDYSRLLGADAALRGRETGNIGYRFYKTESERKQRPRRPAGRQKRT